MIRLSLAMMMAITLSSTLFAEKRATDFQQPQKLFGNKKPPESRSQSQILKILNVTPKASSKNGKALHLVFVASKKTHGKDQHDYPVWQHRWSNLFASAKQVTTSTAQNWPSEEQFKKADLIAFNAMQKGKLDAAKAKRLHDYLSQGGAMINLHIGVDGRNAAKEMSECIGLVWSKGAKFRHGPMKLTITQPNHPIMQGLGDKIEFYDEVYWNLTGDPKAIDVLATSQEKDEITPQIWTKTIGKGRTFAHIGGHYSWTYDDPIYRIQVFRGMAWAMKQPIDRFNDLVLIGARVKEDAKAISVK